MSSTVLIFNRTAHDGLLDRINQLCALHKATEPAAGTSAITKLLPHSLSEPIKFNNRNDFPLVSVWTSAWAAHPLNKKKVTQDVSLFRKTDVQTNPNNRSSMSYLQDSQGQPVTEMRAATICTTARGLFQHLRNQGMAPKTWSKRSDPAAQYFYREMIKFEPNFLMADDTWKLERLATDIYFNWSRQQKDNNDHDVKPEVKVEEISSISVSGKKRKASLPAEIRTDAGGSKKTKTLESSESETSVNSQCKFNIFQLFVFY